MNNRRHVLCERTYGSCSYYSSCLEPQFPCESTGIILQYAKRRCEAARKFDHSSLGCSTCIKNEDLVIWSHTVEECIQDGLRDLMAREFANIKSDKPTCQTFERRAVETINTCYRGLYDSKDKPHLCHLLGEEVDEHELRDLKKLVSEFHVGGHYHNTTVNSGIPELLRECGHSDVADTLYAGEPTYRLIFCSWAVLLKQGPPYKSDHILRFMSQNLGDDESNFVYSGRDWTNACRDNVPSNAQGENTEYHIVTWFASASNAAARNWNKTGEAFLYNNGRAITGYFELSSDREEPRRGTIRDSSKCGDGVRQAGEVCDYALLDSPACSFECDLRDGLNGTKYECSTDQLERSYCWTKECGDGKRMSNETCDDGNRNNNDGCDANCQIETRYSCTDVYNATSLCSLLSPGMAVQHQNTRSQIVRTTDHTEVPAELPNIVDSPFDTSSGRSIFSSRTSTTTVSVVVLATLWTAIIWS